MLLGTDQECFTEEQNKELMARSRKLSAGIYNLIQHLNRSRGKHSSGPS